MARIIAHVDMDAFFASCEESRRPELAGEPIVVGADPNGGEGRGVVVAANYAARAFGIRSAMPIRDAWKRNPHAHYLPADHRYYSEVSHRIFDALRRERILEQVSIDEAYIDLGVETDWAHAAEAATEIHRTVKEAAGGLTCSVGVAPNKLVAKIASDHRKPNGTTVVPPDTVTGFLAPLAAHKVPGIGPKTTIRLEEQGVRTIGGLRRFGREGLVSLFGSHGAWMWAAAHGHDDSEVQTSWEPHRSVSEEHTFGRDTHDRRELLSMLRRMVASLEADLMGHGYWYKTVAVKARFSDFDTHTKQASLPRHVGDTEAARRLIPRLLDAFLADRRHIRLIGLRFGEISHGLGQRTLHDYAPRLPMDNPVQPAPKASLVGTPLIASVRSWR